MVISPASAQKNNEYDGTFKLVGIYGHDRVPSNDRSENTRYMTAIFLFTTTLLSPSFHFLIFNYVLYLCCYIFDMANVFPLFLFN